LPQLVAISMLMFQILLATIWLIYQKVTGKPSEESAQGVSAFYRQPPEKFLKGYWQVLQLLNISQRADYAAGGTKYPME
jgi:hypothetical protein